MFRRKDKLAENSNTTENRSTAAVAQTLRGSTALGSSSVQEQITSSGRTVAQAQEPQWSGRERKTKTFKCKADIILCGVRTEFFSKNHNHIIMLHKLLYLYTGSQLALGLISKYCWVNKDQSI